MRGYSLKRDKPFQTTPAAPQSHRIPTLQEVFKNLMTIHEIKTQEEMGKLVNMSGVTVGRVLSGEQRTMKEASLAEVCERFKLPLEKMLLVNALRALPDDVQSKIEASDEDALWDDLLLSATYPRSLPTYSEIRLPAAAWPPKEGKMAADALENYAIAVTPPPVRIPLNAEDDAFLFLHRGMHLLSADNDARVVPHGSYVLVNRVPEAEIHNGDLVLVQFLDDNGQPAEQAIVLQYIRRTKEGYLWEEYRSANPQFPPRIRDSGKFGERRVLDSRIIIGRVVSIAYLGLTSPL